MRTIDRPTPTSPPRTTDLARPAPSPGDSEYGVLHSVVIDPGTGSADLWLEERLVSRGIGVLRLGDLLVDVLGNPGVARLMAARVAALEASSPAVRRRIERALLSAPPAVAAGMILRGIPASDRDAGARSPGRARYLVPPQSAERSVREPIIATGSDPFIALVPGREARRAVAVMSAVTHVHPEFASGRPRRYRHDPEQHGHDALLDGDDVQVAPDGSVLVGVGRRSNLGGARRLALSVLASRAVPRVLAVSLVGGGVERLDQLIAVLGSRRALVHPAALSDDAVTWELRASGEERGPALRADAPRPFRDFLPGLLDLEATIHRVPIVPGAHGPQHFLVVAPDEVLTSAPLCDPTSALLDRAGVGVSGLPEERSRATAAGGVRRLVLPVRRGAGGPSAL